jgi:hypothetical protein
MMVTLARHPSLTSALSTRSRKRRIWLFHQPLILEFDTLLDDEDAHIPHFLHAHCFQVTMYDEESYHSHEYPALASYNFKTSRKQK